MRNGLFFNGRFRDEYSMKPRSQRSHTPGANHHMEGGLQPGRPHSSLGNITPNVRHENGSGKTGRMGQVTDSRLSQSWRESGARVIGIDRYDAFNKIVLVWIGAVGGGLPAVFRCPQLCSAPACDASHAGRFGSCNRSARRAPVGATMNDPSAETTDLAAGRLPRPPMRGRWPDRPSRWLEIVLRG